MNRLAPNPAYPPRRAAFGSEGPAAPAPWISLTPHQFHAMRDRDFTKSVTD